MAELTATLGRSSSYKNIFISVSRRINAALNMQRTVVLTPDGNGNFKPSVLQGYPAEEEAVIASRSISAAPELLDPEHPILITGADSPDRLLELREALGLPYLISSPIVLHDEVAAILVTGRELEQLPWMPRLGRNDVETVQTVSAYLAAMFAGQRLIEAEERTQIMLDATPLCCSFLDDRGEIIDCNQEAARLFNLSCKQEYLDRFIDLSPERQPDGSLSSERAAERVRETFASGYVRFEWMHQKLDGELIPAEITLVRVKRDEGYIVAGYTRDLREEKAMLAEMLKTESELRLARDLSEKNAKAKSEFLANMSHEIRTPMNAVLSVIQLLANTEMSDKQMNYLEKAKYSANALMNIINDILNFSKIDAGQMKMENVEFSIRNLVYNVRNAVNDLVREKSLELRIDMTSDFTDLVIGDPSRLEQVLFNLLNNAIKFTRMGEISIRVFPKTISTKEIQLQFEIKDTGIGMLPEQASNLFVPFTQADNSYTRKYGGAGLGLAISKSLVEMMHGTIWCESLQGEGSTFIFTATFALPMEQGQKRQSPGGNDEKAAAIPDFESLRGMHVLLAEDNEINQFIAVEFLSAKGISVDVVPNGRKALEALEHNSYDLVLMDIQMPEMDGLTATVQIRSNPEIDPALPIIALTAHVYAEDRELSLNSGMNDHLTKPIDADLLYETLQHWDRRPPKDI